MNFYLHSMRTATSIIDTIRIGYLALGIIIVCKDLSIDLFSLNIHTEAIEVNSNAGLKDPCEKSGALARIPSITQSMKLCGHHLKVRTYGNRITYLKICDWLLYTLGEI